LRVTVPSDREFVAIEDPLPGGLEAVDLSLRTSGTVDPFATARSEAIRDARDREAGGVQIFGDWSFGWWSPWQHIESRDDRVLYFARMLWKGSYTASYVARATTSGRFVRPQAHAEEMYNPALSGRSEGGWFVVRGR
jgi:alpha-2-macroglobulin